MKKFAVIALSLILSGTAIYAQDTTRAAKKAAWQQKSAAEREQMRKGHRGGDMYGKKAQEALGLTTDQQQTFKQINEDYRKQAQAIWKDKSLTEAAKKEQFQQLKKGQQEKIKGALNADQYAKYQQMHEKRMERMKKMEKQQDRQLPGKAAPGKS
jgi:flagellar biosynthesis GTPase FlhF